MIYYKSKSLDSIIAIVKSGEVYNGQVMESKLCRNDCVYIDYCHGSSIKDIENDDDLNYIVERILECTYDHETAGFFKLRSLYVNAFKAKTRKNILF